MRHPLLGTIRRELAVAVTLVAIGTGVLTAAHFRASPPGESPELLDYDSSIRKIAPSGDIQLRPSVAPLFAHSGTPATAQVQLNGNEIPVPAVAAAPGATTLHRQWTGFTSVDHPGSSAPRRSGSSGGSSFSASVSGMSMGGAWGGVSGSAAGGATTASGTPKAVTSARKAATQSARAASVSSSHAPSVKPAEAGSQAEAGPAVAQPVFQQAQHPTVPPAGHGPDLPDSTPGPGGPGGPAPVPEPATLMLVGVAAVGLYALRRHLR
jgi:hypothetical protein